MKNKYLTTLRYSRRIEKRIFLAFLLTFFSFPFLIQAQEFESNKIAAPTADGNLDSTFNPSVTEGLGYVNETAMQTDGKIIAVGLFQRANGTQANGIARFNADGTLDTTFISGTGANAVIQAVALQSNGKILIGGAFTSYNGQTVNRLARLNSNGTIDSSFNSPVIDNNQVLDIALRADGSILVAGSFSYFGARLIGLNSDGAYTTSYNISRTVTTIVSLPDGKVLASGDFSYSEKIIRFNTDGRLDQSFTPVSGLNYQVLKLLIQPDGKILVAGSSDDFNGMAVKGLIRLNSDGSLNTVFPVISEPNSTRLAVNSIALQADGKVLAGYSYQKDSGEDRSGVLRFNSGGTLDSTFTTNSIGNQIIRDVNILTNSKIIIGGNFTEFSNQTRLRLLKLNATGTIDNSFNPSVSTQGVVYAIKKQADGKIIIGGDFDFVNGVSKRGIARLNADGTLDNTFNIGTGLSGDVFSLLIQPEGKILIGGNFTSYNGNQAYHIARLNSDGSFNANLNTDDTLPIVYVYALALQPDNKILIGGNIVDVSAGNFIALIRINQNGGKDSSFTPFSGFPGTVRDVLVQPSGKIVIGGDINLPSPNNRFGVARLNSDGTLDNGFTAGASFTYTLKQSSDGKVYVGSLFGLQRFNADGTLDASFNEGVSDRTVRAIEIQPDGKVIVGGNFVNFNNVAVNHIVRLKADGSIDSTFNTGSGTPGAVLSLTLQSDNKILVGGQFYDFNNTEKFSLARLLNNSTIAKTLFDFDGDGKADISVFRPSNGSWYLQQSQNGFTGVQFGVSTDKIVPADYDGDGKTDIAVYRSGTWYLQRSQLGFTGVSFGTASDIPVAGDYDGDGKADIAVFRPSNGTWYLQRSQLGFIGIQFGQSGDKPVAADYDGDGKIDIAVNRNGIWYLQRSTLGFTSVTFGLGTDTPTSADYDGDGKADVAVFRPSNGTWYLQRSTAGFTGVAFGLGTDLPAAADYDGDGKTDVAVFRPSNGVWYSINTSNNAVRTTQFGQNGDKPAPNAFVP